MAGTYYSACSLLIHLSFHSNAWDLGLIDQVIWNTARGEWFEYSFRNISYVGDHWQPILVVLVPLKCVTDGPAPLLLAQGLLLGSAVIPLHAAANRLLAPVLAWAPVLAYSMGLGVARAASFDFHAEAFTPLAAFTAFWAVTSRRPVWFVGSNLLVLLTKEDGVLVVAGLCLVAWVIADWRRLASAVVSVAVIYAAVVNVWLIPHYRGSDLNPLAERYGYLGSSIGEILVHVVTRPDLVADKLASGTTLDAVVVLLAGAAFLPILVPRLLPALALVTVPPLLSQDGSQPRFELHYLLVPSTVAIVLATLALGSRTGLGGGASLAPTPGCCVVGTDARAFRCDVAIAAVIQRRMGSL